KVLRVQPPLELFSLEEKAAPLPGGLFVCVKSLSARSRSRDGKKSSARKSFSIQIPQPATPIGFSFNTMSAGAQYCCRCDALCFRREIRCGRSGQTITEEHSLSLLEQFRNRCVRFARVVRAFRPA